MSADGNGDQAMGEEAGNSRHHAGTAEGETDESQQKKRERDAQYNRKSRAKTRILSDLKEYVAKTDGDHVCLVTAEGGYFSAACLQPALLAATWRTLCRTPACGRGMLLCLMFETRTC